VLRHRSRQAARSDQTQRPALEPAVDEVADPPLRQEIPEGGASVAAPAGDLPVTVTNAREDRRVLTDRLVESDPGLELVGYRRKVDQCPNQ